MTEKERKHTVRITNIQRFCLHDGPGIRTTVFLKGCSIHCPWCCNPENINYDMESFHDPVTHETGVYGYDITLQALREELLKDQQFYLDGGGVTFSGGEPLLQIKQYAPLLGDLKTQGIHLAIETALFVKAALVELALPFFDFWYVDVKPLLPSICSAVIGGRVEQYKGNFAYVAKHARSVCVRIPCCNGITNSEENIREVCAFLRTFQNLRIQIFPVHHMGDKKYVSLGLASPALSADHEDALMCMERGLAQGGMSYELMHL